MFAFRVSLSLGGGFSTAMNAAVDAAHRAGVVCAVAAGNSNSNACNDSPASAALAVTVSASDINDIKASFSSFGACCDLYAPGVSILSTQPGGGTALFSGTLALSVCVGVGMPVPRECPVRRVRPE